MGNGEYQCKLCYNAYGTYKCDNCSKCMNSSQRKEWEREERERRERERREREKAIREWEERIRREREERERREREERERREREEREEEKAKEKFSSLLQSISNRIKNISLSDYTFNTSCVNQKTLYLKNEKVSNLYCYMNSVGSAYSESINTSLNTERVFEQKSNYLYNESDELSLENLRTINVEKEKIRFSKKF